MSMIFKDLWLFAERKLTACVNKCPGTSLSSLICCHINDQKRTSKQSSLKCWVNIFVDQTFRRDYRVYKVRYFHHFFHFPFLNNLRTNGFFFFKNRKFRYHFYQRFTSKYSACSCKIKK